MPCLAPSDSIKGKGMSAEIERFIRDYLKEIREYNAAVFAGAGLSAPAGYVNWSELLRPVADDLELDIERETDLVAVAQYYLNDNRGNRHQLNQLLIDRMPIGATPTGNHRILARLPITTYWTTNYDHLIEDSLRNAGKIADVKHVVAHLATTKPRRDAVVYKMHGDIDHPHETVLTKDDYEKYYLDRGAFVNALSGDLVSKTFLFLGFSFTDPNLDYILSRVRVTFRQHQRRHYCIFRRRERRAGESDAEFTHAQVKQRLVIEDLRRFNIRTLLVEEYADITKVLARIEQKYRQRTIFISGSAVEYGAWTKGATDDFLRDLSRELIAKGYRIATGVGLGIGDGVISGAIEQIFAARTGHIEDSLVMRPFPRVSPDERLWEAYRQELISTAGICLLLFGNKDGAAGAVSAEGVAREFAIARERGLYVVPVGATGYVARDLWQQVVANLDQYYPNASSELRNLFARLGDDVAEPKELIPAIVQLVAIIAAE